MSSVDKTLLSKPSIKNFSRDPRAQNTTTQEAQPLWDFQVLNLDGKSITVGTITIALLLCFGAYFLSRAISKVLFKRVLVHLPLEEGMKHVWKTVTFYIFLFVFILFIMHLLNIPITVFTVLGGALAIGVGFGSQNIVNNFISGLVILMERPLKLGDVISVDGIEGRVEFIGARSTKIKTVDNTHIVVPNSSFLEKNVLNWTLSDDVMRVSIDVGVAYNSDIHKVKEILDGIMEAEPRVLSQPRPVILLHNFGNSAIEFKVYFWSRLPYKLIELEKLRSVLRYEIADQFKKHQVVIAFPQRDVHVDIGAPIKIQNITN